MAMNWNGAIGSFICLKDTSNVKSKYEEHYNNKQFNHGLCTSVLCSFENPFHSLTPPHLSLLRKENMARSRMRTLCPSVRTWAFGLTYFNFESLDF